jgi:hypothetical protein
VFNVNKICCLSVRLVFLLAELSVCQPAVRNAGLTEPVGFGLFNSYVLLLFLCAYVQ